MSTEEERRRFVDDLTKEWADQGKVLQGGWAAFEYLILQGAPDIQREEMRKAYFAGAQHLFASIMTVLDPGDEPTDQDLVRMEMISKELAAFEMEVTNVHKPGRG